MDRSEWAKKLRGNQMAKKSLKKAKKLEETKPLLVTFIR